MSANPAPLPAQAPLSPERLARLQAAVGDLDPAALNWASGYLAALAAERGRGAGATGASAASVRATVLYASQTGNGRRVAEKLGRSLAAAGLPGEALASFRRALYLDRRLAVAHFGTASAGEKLGDHGLARRGYRNALGIASGMPPSETVPLSDGETAARFAEGCRARLGSLRKEGS